MGGAPSRGVLTASGSTTPYLRICRFGTDMRRRLKLGQATVCCLGAILVLTAISACTPAIPSDGDPNSADPNIGDPSAVGRDDLLYVLQPDAVSVNALANADFYWLVLEPSVDGGASGDFSAAEVSQIRDDGPCQKRILAYLSIGEAEYYRDYWDPAWVDAGGAPIPGVAPNWLGPSNPNYPGNYKVRYWDPDWQALLFGTTSGPDKTPLDRIIDQGFDGVYLDIVDAYEFWGPEDEGNELSRMTARRHMIDLVAAIADYARGTRGATGFLVFPQNAGDIIRDDDYEFDADTTRYFAAISGIGQEDLYYDELTAQPADEIEYVLEQLREFAARGKTVLVTDYVVNAGNPAAAANNARVSDFYAGCRAEGFVPYAANNDRDLNEIVTFVGAGWTYSQPTAGCPD